MADAGSAASPEQHDADANAENALQSAHRLTHVPRGAEAGAEAEAEEPESKAGEAAGEQEGAVPEATWARPPTRCGFRDLFYKEQFETGWW